jgi:hypothetical protein
MKTPRYSWRGMGYLAEVDAEGRMHFTGYTSEHHPDGTAEYHLRDGRVITSAPEPPQ